MTAAAGVRPSALVLLALLLGPLAAAAQEGRPIGIVAALVGAAQVERFRGADLISLGVGSELFEGDRVVTASEARVKLELIDGSVLQLGEQTELELTWVLYAPQEETRNILVSMGLGIVRSIAEAVVPRSWFELRTATAITSVRGTEWIAEAQPDATAVVSLEGEVAVENIDQRIDGVAVLGPGEGTTVRAGEPPAPVSEWGRARVESFIARTSVGSP